MLPFTIEQIAPYVVALIGALGVWITARTRKRGDAESNVMDRFEKMIDRADKREIEDETRMATMRAEIDALKVDRDKQNRNIARLQGDIDRMSRYIQKHLPGRDDIPTRTELEP